MPTSRFAQFALPGELEFDAGPGGLGFVHIRNEQATASVCLQGAQLTAWQPRSQAEPVIWTSPSAQAIAGKSLRGGAPVCWPWFGPHPDLSKLPSHGFVRGLPWAVCASGRGPGTTHLVLTIEDSEQSRLQWPHRFALELHLRVGAALEMELVSINRDTKPFVITQALHTYFRIGDIEAIQVEGLQGVSYIDKTHGGECKVERDPIRFTQEVDRVYCATSGECRIEDPVLGRRIRIAKTASRSTVVWNPWDQKAAAMGDLGPGQRNLGGWRDMVCVESGNVLNDFVEVAPGTSHRMAVRYSAETI